jgi:hypothetical protein
MKLRKPKLDSKIRSPEVVLENIYLQTVHTQRKR